MTQPAPPKTAANRQARQPERPSNLQAQPQRLNLVVQMGDRSLELGNGQEISEHVHEHSIVTFDQVVKVNWRELNATGAGPWNGPITLRENQELHRHPQSPLRRAKLCAELEVQWEGGGATLVLHIASALDAAALRALHADLSESERLDPHVSLQSPGQSAGERHKTGESEVEHLSALITEVQQLVLSLSSEREKKPMRSAGHTGQIDRKSLERNLRSGSLKIEGGRVRPSHANSPITFSRKRPSDDTPSNAALAQDIEDILSKAQQQGENVTALRLISAPLLQKRQSAPNWGLQRHRHDPRYARIAKINSILSSKRYAGGDHLTRQAAPQSTWALYELWVEKQIIKLLQRRGSKLQTIRNMEISPHQLRKHSGVMRLYVQPSLSVYGTRIQPDFILHAGQRLLILDAKLSRLSGALSTFLSDKSAGRYVRVLRGAGLRAEAALIHAPEREARKVEIDADCHALISCVPGRQSAELELLLLRFALQSLQGSTEAL